MSRCKEEAKQYAKELYMTLDEYGNPAYTQTDIIKRVQKKFGRKKGITRGTLVGLIRSEDWQLKLNNLRAAIQLKGFASFEKIVDSDGCEIDDALLLSKLDSELKVANGESFNEIVKEIIQNRSNLVVNAGMIATEMSHVGMIIIRVQLVRFLQELQKKPIEEVDPNKFFKIPDAINMIGQLNNFVTKINQINVNQTNLQILPSEQREQLLDMIKGFDI